MPGEPEIVGVNIADKSEIPNACEDPRVRYDKDVRLSKSGKPIPKGLTPWRKGQSGNPGGAKKGFVGPALAYREVSQLTYQQTVQLSKGKFPVGWPKGREFAYVRAAQESLSAGSRGKPEEINGRIEGPIGQNISLSLEGGPLAILASLQPPAAAQLEAIDTPALPEPEDAP